MLADERLASALGFKVSKVYQESRIGQCGTPGNDQTQVNENDNARNLVVLETGQSSMVRRPCRWSNSHSPFVGTLVYIIVLILLSASIFGLEVYRIREVNMLSERMELVHNNLDLIRTELMAAMAPPGSEREFVNLMKSEKPLTEYRHSVKRRHPTKREYI